MLKNYFKSAYRSLLFNKSFSAINILGLAIGIASFILITLYIYHELSYDRYHDKADRIYRIVENIQTDTEQLLQATSSPPMGPTLAQEFPEVVGFVRFSNWLSNGYIVRKGDKVFNEKECYVVDSSVFNIFSFRLLKGNPKTALVAPKSIVLTEKTAKKYFGDVEPLGQTLEVNHENYQVTGILAKIPENSHFKFDILISWSTAITNNEWANSQWGYNAFYTYLLLAEGKDVPQNLAAKIPAYIDKYIGKFSKETKSYFTDLPLQPLSSIYLESPRSWENGERGSKNNIVILSTIAVFILVIACFNYVNLTTARASRRLKEVGLRKTLGAQRSALVIQFLGESIIICFIGTVLGALIVILLLPTFNNLAETSLSFKIGNQGAIWIVLLAGSILIGFISGIYPAFFVSGFRPLHIFKAVPNTLFSGQWLRKILVSSQFIISMTLIAGALLVREQLHLLSNFNLGFDKEKTLVLDVSGRNSDQRLEAIKDKLKTIPGVIGVSASSNVPGESMGNSYCLIEKIEGRMSEASMNTLMIDYDFIPNYSIKAIAGRAFSRDYPTDTAAFVINEAAIRSFGLASPEEALGRNVDLQGRKGIIVGVLKDFHYRSLHFGIEPLILYINYNELQKLSLKIQSPNLAATVVEIENMWKTVLDPPFNYSFLDQDYDRLYKRENQLSKFVAIFSALAIFVACLGLIGLSSFSMERRFKEIGIRKVLGASLLGILALVSKEFMRLILVSFVIAVPLTTYMMSHWLDGFTNRIAIQPMIFVITGSFISIVAAIIIGCLSLNAARSNPVNALRSE